MIRIEVVRKADFKPHPPIISDGELNVAAGRVTFTKDATPVTTPSRKDVVG